MPKVRFGFSVGSYPMGMPDADWIFRLADQLEESGFDIIAAGDHIEAMSSPIIDALTLLAACAGRTSRISLMTNVYLLPLRNPVVVAKIVSSLDFLSRGRVIFGVGVGGENPREFEACGIPLAERGARTDESLEILRKVWTTSPASHSGRFWQFRDISVEPKPIQSGGPPIWIGGRSDKALLRSVRFGSGWTGYAATPERFEASAAKIVQYAKTDGVDLSDFVLGYTPFIYVSPSAATARDVAMRYTIKMHNQPSYSQTIDKYAIVGAPDDCIRQIERYVALGARFICLRVTCPLEEVLDQVVICGKEIIPHFRREKS